MTMVYGLFLAVVVLVIVVRGLEKRIEKLEREAKVSGQQKEK
jgi:hypothetical protein